ALQRFGGFDSIQIVHHGGTFLVREGPVPDQDGAFLVPNAVEVLCFVNAPPLPVHPGNRKENENVPWGKRRGNGPSSPAVLRGEGERPRPWGPPRFRSVAAVLPAEPRETRGSEAAPGNGPMGPNP